MRHLTAAATLLLVFMLVVGTTARVNAVRPPAPLASSTTAAETATPPARVLEPVGQISAPVQAIAVHGIYAATISFNQLVLLNIADPTHPRAIAYLTLSVNSAVVALDDRYAYI